MSNDFLLDILIILFDQWWTYTSNFSFWDSSKKYCITTFFTKSGFKVSLIISVLPNYKTKPGFSHMFTCLNNLTWHLKKIVSLNCTLKSQVWNNLPFYQSQYRSQTANVNTPLGSSHWHCALGCFTLVWMLYSVLDFLRTKFVRDVTFAKRSVWMIMLLLLCFIATSAPAVMFMWDGITTFFSKLTPFGEQATFLVCNATLGW